MTALDPKSVQMIFGYVLPHQCVLEAEKIPGQSRKVLAHVFLTSSHKRNPDLGNPCHS
jgi:hypothetical protein